MILPFSLILNNKPTHFVEKIWNCLKKDASINEFYEPDEIRDIILACYKKGFDVRSRDNGYTPKKHTIREDKKNRWKEGSKIHFTINNRTKDSFRFAPVIQVRSVQKIVIYALGSGAANGSGVMVLIDNKHFGRWNYGCSSDGNRGAENIEKLAYNDGFDSVQDFVKYFSSGDNIAGEFRGKIIHWTDLKY